ncbi:MAG: septal ring lytic transglycosylase RlpA family protein [Rickettsiales bacterium]
MKLNRLFAIATVALLTACSDNSMRPVYSGREESTVGVPGFINGKKGSPNVKLGQSYTVAGETYVPRHEPDYDEVGMASWYGPGFHGGKTANGERFDASELTAAHRTLPLPSIVRVTMLSTGKQVYVRVNDRGPFSKNRIIDLSRAAAEKIGLLRSGTAKVRVQYMQKESERFANLITKGRDPKSIDLASEVLDYDGTESDTAIARTDTRDVNNGSFWDNFRSKPEPTSVSNPRVFASNETNDAAPVSEVESSDLAAPAEEPKKAVTPPAAAKKAATVESTDDSPFAVLEPSASKEAAKEIQVASVAPRERVATAIEQKAAAASAPMGDPKIYVQLGAFSNQANAEKLRKQYADIGGLKIIRKPNSAGQDLYHVRMGPYPDNEASTEAMDQLEAAGAEPKIVRE